VKRGIRRSLRYPEGGSSAEATILHCMGNRVEKYSESTRAWMIAAEIDFMLKLEMISATIE
jgi:hypothetical protein